MASANPVSPLLRAVCVTLILFGALHSAGQAFFRTSVGGIGLLFVGVSADEKKPTSELGEKWDRDMATAREDLKVELAMGLTFGVLCVLELAAAILIAVGSPSKAGVAICLIALGVMGWRASHITHERAQSVEQQRREAERSRATDEHPAPKAHDWYDLGVGGGPGDYLPSALHASGALFGAALGVVLVLRKRKPAFAPF